jgi:hypothetical protein
MAAGSHTVVVPPGVGTISAAVAAAQPGDTLQLKKGAYYDSVEIQTTLTIRGEGDSTVIKPPVTSPDNDCNVGGFVKGLCVVGQLDSQGNPDLSRPVVGVLISDLRTSGFPDSGAFGFNTRGFRVTDVQSDHNGAYGIARFASTRSLFATTRRPDCTSVTRPTPPAPSSTTGRTIMASGYFFGTAPISSPPTTLLQATASAS